MALEGGDVSQFEQRDVAEKAERDDAGALTALLKYFHAKAAIVLQLTGLAHTVRAVIALPQRSAE